MLLFDAAGVICGVQSFCGREGEDVQDFLRSFNVYSKLAGWNEDLKCRGVWCFMDGIARIWYNVTSNECKWRRGSAVVRGVDVLSNWGLLEDAIKKRFDVEEEPMILRYRLSVRRQHENESVSDYAVAKEYMMCKLNPVMCEEEKLSHFVSGLLPMFQIVVVSQKPCTMQEAVKIASDHDRALRLVNEINASAGSRNSVYADPVVGPMSYLQVPGVADVDGPQYPDDYPIMCDDVDADGSVSVDAEINVEQGAVVSDDSDCDAGVDVLAATSCDAVSVGSADAAAVDLIICNDELVGIAIVSGDSNNVAGVTNDDAVKIIQPDEDCVLVGEAAAKIPDAVVTERFSVHTDVNVAVAAAADIIAVENYSEEVDVVVEEFDMIERKVETKVNQVGCDTSVCVEVKQVQQEINSIEKEQRNTITKSGELNLNVGDPILYRDVFPFYDEDNPIDASLCVGDLPAAPPW
jgi:hypothetical protein